MCRGTKPWRSGRSNPLYQRALEAMLAGVTLSRAPGRKPVPTGAICGCLWDIMGCYGGQWETILIVWNSRVLGDCGKMRAHAFGTKPDHAQVRTTPSQDIAAERCSFPVLMKKEIYARFGRENARRPISRVL